MCKVNQNLNCYILNIFLNSGCKLIMRESELGTTLAWSQAYRIKMFLKNNLHE